jgi:hypothetical protein
MSGSSIARSVDVDCGGLLGELVTIPMPVSTPERVPAPRWSIRGRGPIDPAFPAVVKTGCARTAANVDAAARRGCAILIESRWGRRCEFLNDGRGGSAEMRFGAGRDRGRSWCLMGTGTAHAVHQWLFAAQL